MLTWSILPTHGNSAYLCPLLASLFAQSKNRYRGGTSVPTFFVRMLGKLLNACIPLDETARVTCRARAVDDFLTVGF